LDLFVSGGQKKGHGDSPWVRYGCAGGGWREPMAFYELKEIGGRFLYLGIPGLGFGRGFR
jgi:hypothetical protein